MYKQVKCASLVYICTKNILNKVEAKVQHFITAETVPSSPKCLNFLLWWLGEKHYKFCFLSSNVLSDIFIIFEYCHFNIILASFLIIQGFKWDINYARW